jgi:hypothetical protein
MRPYLLLGRRSDHDPNRARRSTSAREIAYRAAPLTSPAVQRPRNPAVAPQALR